MTALDLEAEYNNRQRVPAHPAIVARWIAESARARADLASTLDIAYGPQERQRYDLFHAATAAQDAPVVVYIHGGYWAARDRKDYSFVARAFANQGITVAIPSYTLCPATTVAGIIDEMRAFLAALHKRTGRRAVVAGHSAGGHLAASMLATDWSTIAGAPAGLVTAAYAISGVFELEPLIATSINDPLHLDAAAARAASPLLWPAPTSGTLVAAVGGIESSEFLRQSRVIAGAWARSGVATEYYAVPDADHFTVLAPLADASSSMSRRIAELARACR